MSGAVATFGNPGSAMSSKMSSGEKAVAADEKHRQGHRRRRLQEDGSESRKRPYSPARTHFLSCVLFKFSVGDPRRPRPSLSRTTDRHSAKPGPNPATSARPPRPLHQQLKQKPNSGGECGIIESSLNPRDSIPHIRRVSAVHFFFRVTGHCQPSPRPIIRSRPSREASKRRSSRDR